MNKIIFLSTFLITSLSFGQNTFPASGNVGIGTINPSQKLTVSGGSISVSNYGNWVGVASPSSGVTSYARILGTDTANPVDRACLTTNGYVSTATGALLQDNISLPTWALTLDANNDAFYIRRAPAGSSMAGALSTFMTVNNLGSVGIGTTTPLQRLDINGGIRFSTGVSGGLYAGEDTNHPRKVFGVDVLGSQFSYIQSPDNDADDGIQFKDSKGNALATVLEGGNVGIGTSHPIAKLHVEGDTYLGTNQLQFLSASGGNNRIQSFGGVTIGSWLIKSRFDNIVIDAGENTGNKRKIIFKIGGEDKMLVDFLGNVGVGTTAPDEKLTVKGKIHAQEVKVDLLGPLVPDYVFANDYKLKTLQEVEAYIKENSHLPEIPSAQEIEKKGLMLAEMNMSLLKKIEELTLYAIEQKKKSDQMMKYIETQNKIILQQNIRLEKLEEKKTSSK